MSGEQKSPSGAVRFYRSDGGYGWSVTVGKRVRWNSRKATCRSWPHFSRGTDEACNRAVTLVLWPLGHLDVWWEPHWRTRTCDTCRALARAEGMCEDCMCRPCDCAERRSENEHDAPVVPPC